MLKRSTFRRPTLERTRTVHTPVPEHLRRKASMAPVAGIPASAIEKESPVRSEAYRRLVAAMPCARCGVHGRSQAAHADLGKGAHIKSDDRTCYPACAAQVGSIGCHALIGSTGTLPREVRRELEALYAAETRAAILNAGLWPKNLPLWTEA
jgi:hypothetical protein